MRESKKGLSGEQVDEQVEKVQHEINKQTLDAVA